MSKDEIIKKILDQHKPDAAQAMEVIKEANDTIAMLINRTKEAETRWTETFVMLATVLNHFDGEIRLTKADMLMLTPNDYRITNEAVEGTDERIIKLMHITEKDD